MKHSCRRTGSAGFTLIEVLAATVVISITFLAAGQGMVTAVESKRQLADQPMTADMLAHEIYELAQSLPKAASGTLAVTSGAAVEALDSLLGAVFSPPIKADGSTMSSHSGWSQRVGLALYSLDDLSTATSDGVFVQVIDGDPSLYQLTVEILDNGQPVDSFQWWIRP